MMLKDAIKILINDVEIGQQASRDAFSKRHLLPTEHWVALGGFRVLLLFCKCIFDLFWRNASLAGIVIAAKYLSCIKISSKEFYSPMNGTFANFNNILMSKISSR